MASIDPSGKVVLQPFLDGPIDDIGDFSSGIARVHHKGYVDENGQWIIKGDYFWLNDFADGLALAIVESATEKYGFDGFYFDSNGGRVANVPFPGTGDFSEGFTLFRAKGKPALRSFEPGHFVYRDYPGLVGFIDRTGNVAIQPAYADVGPFVGGLARAVLDGTCHIATPDGGRQGTPTTGIPTDCGGAPADAVSPCKVGVIDQTGRFAIDPRFESARDFSEGFAVVRVDGRWGFIRSDGTFTVPPRFDAAASFREGLAAIRLVGKWGFVDTAGAIVIAPQFEAVESFSDSLAVAYQNKMPFYIVRLGNRVISGPFLEASAFVQGIAAVRLSERHVRYINKTGAKVFDYYRSPLRRR